MGLTDKKSQKCKRCRAVIANAVTGAGDRVDDLMKRSAIASQIRTDHSICATCQKISSENQNFDELIPRHQKESLFSEGFSAHKDDGVFVSRRTAKKARGYLFWGAIFLFIIFRFFISFADDSENPDNRPILTVDDIAPIDDANLDVVRPPTIIINNKALPFNFPSQWVRGNDYPSKAFREGAKGCSY